MAEGRCFQDKGFSAGGGVLCSQFSEFISTRANKGLQVAFASSFGALKSVDSI